MTPSELAELFDDNVAVHLRLYMTGGAIVHIDDPARAKIHGSLLYDSAVPGRPLRTAGRPKVVSIQCITMIEPRTPLVDGTWTSPTRWLPRWVDLDLRNLQACPGHIS